jgi:putative glutamine amidotransferase
VDVHPNTGERRDALDQNWALFLEAADCLPVILPNRIGDPVELQRTLALEGLLLTGGNDLAHLPSARNTAPERDALERALVQASRAQGLPVMGVCRGAQMLNHLAGGQIVTVAGHVAPRHRLVPLAAAEGLLGPPFEIASYHDFGIGTLGKGLEALALAEDGSVEAFRARDGSQMGILWHPEREAPFRREDIALFQRFFGRQAW